eukprot:10423834-Ditylum_brightwellii.AAC.1
MYSDANLVRESRERRSTTSIALLTNGAATHWDISKQGFSRPVTSATSALPLDILWETHLQFTRTMQVPSKPSLQIELLPLTDIMVFRSPQSQSSTIIRKELYQWNTPRRNIP